VEDWISNVKKDREYNGGIQDVESLKKGRKSCTRIEVIQIRDFVTPRSTPG